jgi:hypothetical protein
LAVSENLPAGSLDALHRDIIAPSCAGQAGLCHNGQFEPNLSTPALAFENLVVRPSLEHKKQLRVAPGAPGASLLIDKLRNRDVISRMPLGADPLAEDDIVAMERWIEGGALRRPDAAPAAQLNNPPEEPAIGVFDASGSRLDALGTVTVSPLTSLTFRQTVSDFETDDSSVPYAVFILQTADQLQLIVNPAAPAGAGGNIGIATFDGANPPNDKGEPLDWRWEWVVPETVDLMTGEGAIAAKGVPTAGMSLTVLAAYVDGPLDQGGMLTFSFVQDLVKVSP